MPTDASVNQNRGNLNFDIGGTPEGEAPDTFIDDHSFEPLDEVKGDVARALFYVDVRYKGTHGEPDLSLVDGSTATGGSALGDLRTLLDWHRADPVSAEELERNILTQGHQGNRKLFIDEPQLADAIFGESCGSPAPEPAPEPALVEGPGSSTTQHLRLATWNIANLHHQSGVSLQQGSVARSNKDFTRLAALAETLDLDIVGLQEMGSPAAVHRVFPPELYHVVMSIRYQAGAENRPADQRDIYTAIVFARDSFDELPQTKTLSALSIEHLGIDRDGEPSSRPTRAGVVTELSIAGETINLVNVHLKSACHRWSLEPVTDQSPTLGKPFRSRFDGRTLKA